MYNPLKNRPLNALAAVLLVAAGVFSAATPSFAHHAFAAEFDADKPVELKGIVTKAKWTNPHSWLYVDVKGVDGSTTNWGFEFGAPLALQQRGLGKDDLQIGTEVIVKGFRAKNGGPFGYSVTVTLPNGRTVQTGGAQDTPATPAAPAARS